MRFSASSRSSSPFLRPLTAALTLVIVALALPAAAAVVDPDHRLERVGTGLEDAVALLPMPGVGRLLVAQRNGDLRLIAGDGLVNDLVGHVDVAQTCAGEGLLSAAWDPFGPGVLLYVSYIQEAPRRLVVATVEFTGRQAGAATPIFDVGAATNCENLGGGLGWAPDGTLLVGVGDMGVPSAAQQVTQTSGKVLRLNPDGSIPTGNVLPTSPVYGMGVRNPVRFIQDPLTNTVYFIDLGPGEDDELNPFADVVTEANYGWPTATGPMETPGRTDPVYTWVTPIVPLGGVSYRGQHLGGDFNGDFLVAAATGTVTRLDTDGATPDVSGEIELYTPEPDDTYDWTDAIVLRDGYVYMMDRGGDLWRFRSDVGVPTEPSARLDIVPLVVTKTSPTEIVVHVEREAAATTYGLYYGDLGPNTGAGLNHGATADEYAPEGADAPSAYMAFPIATASVARNAYFLASADSPREETTLGTSSNNIRRPGGGIVHACEAGCDTAGWGVQPGQCAEDFVVQWGLWDQDGNYSEPEDVIGPVSFKEDYDCDVVVMGLAGWWCGWCHVAAPELQRMYEDYGDIGFMMIELIYSDSPASVDATMDTVRNWLNRHQNTHPLLLDENRRNNNRWFDNGRLGCGGYPQYFITDGDGLITDFVCGADTAAIEVAVRRNLGLP